MRTIGSVSPLKALAARLLLTVLSVPAIILLAARLLAILLLPINLLAVRLAVLLLALIIVAVRIAVIAVVVAVIIIVDILAARPALLVETGTAFAQHTEIMVSELEIIFGLNAIPRKLRVTRHALVLLKELRRIAALASVARVSAAAAVAAHSLPWLPAATTTAPSAVLTIVDQVCWSSSHWRQARLFLSFGKKSGPPGMSGPPKRNRLRLGPSAEALRRPMSSEGRSGASSEFLERLRP